MKTPEKMLKKLLKKAVILNEETEISISQENLTEAGIVDIYNASGKKIFLKGNILYRETSRNSQDWLFYIIGKNQESIEKRLKALEDWTFKFKQYVDNKFKEMKK